MILIVGATGTIGRDVVKNLVARGETVRAMSRDADKARALPGWKDLDIVTADPAKPESLGAAFAGVNKVLIMAPGGPGWVEIEQNLIDAAKQAGVSHIVQISAMGADPGQPSLSLSGHFESERRLAASGVPYTVLRANSFMQNFLVFYAATIRTDGVVYQCTGDAPMAMVDTRDIADVAAHVLTSDGHAGKVYELTGPEALSYTQATQKIGDVTGSSVRYQDVPPDAYLQALLGAGLPEFLAREVVDIYGRGYYREGKGAVTTSSIQELLGRPARSFGDFARDHADSFRAQ